LPFDQFNEFGHLFLRHITCLEPADMLFEPASPLELELQFRSNPYKLAVRALARAAAALEVSI